MSHSYGWCPTCHDLEPDCECCIGDWYPYCSAGCQVEALEWYLSVAPCPEIHASVNNRPGRCPEDSDDPGEWCASARFRAALGGSDEL